MKIQNKNTIEKSAKTIEGSDELNTVEPVRISAIVFAILPRSCWKINDKKILYLI